MFPSGNLIVLGFTFMSMIHFEFCVWCEVGLAVGSFLEGTQLFQHLFVEKSILFPPCTKVRNKWYII